MSTAKFNLINHNWTYTFEDGAVGQLSFSQDWYGANAGQGSNQTGASYEVVNEDHIKFGLARTTMMMEAPEVRARRGAIANSFRSEGDNGVPFKFNLGKDVTLILGGVTWQGELKPEALYGVPATQAFYDIYPTTEYPSQWKWRKVTYDENFVKATAGDWSEYKIGTVKKGGAFENDTGHEWRVRVNEFIVKDQVKDIYFDMITTCTVVKK